jgi:hypothetical protein
VSRQGGLYLEHVGYSLCLQHPWLHISRPKVGIEVGSNSAHRGYRLPVFTGLVKFPSSNDPIFGNVLSSPPFQDGLSRSSLEPSSLSSPNYLSNFCRRSVTFQTESDFVGSYHHLQLIKTNPGPVLYQRFILLLVNRIEKKAQSKCLPQQLHRLLLTSFTTLSMGNKRLQSR